MMMISTTAHFWGPHKESTQLNSFSHGPGSPEFASVKIGDLSVIVDADGAAQLAELFQKTVSVIRDAVRSATGEKDASTTEARP